MNKGTRQSGALMLVELLLAVMFFAVCAAICLQLFVTAQQAGEKSVAMNNAAIQAQNAAEAWKASEGDLAKTVALLGWDAGGMVSESLSEAGGSGTYEISQSYNKDWDLVDAGEGVYTMILTPLSNVLDITVRDASGAALFAITSAVPARGVYG